MNPFEILGLMAIGGAIVFVLLTAMLRLESRLMNGVVRDDRRSQLRAGPGDPVEAADVKLVARDIVAMNDRIRVLYRAAQDGPLDHLAPLVRHAEFAAATARPFAVGDSHRVGRTAAEFAALRLRLVDAQRVLRLVVDVLVRANGSGVAREGRRCRS